MRLATKVSIAAALAAVSLHAAAQRVTLSCKSNDGDQMVPLTIDYDARSATWGRAGVYSVVHVTDQHVTLLESNASTIGSPRPGGGVWVIDRYDGQFQRAWAGMSCSTPACTDRRLNASTQSGTCRTQAF